MNYNKNTNEIKESEMVKNMYKLFNNNSFTIKELKEQISFLKAYRFENRFYRDLMVSFVEQELIKARINKTATVKVAFHLKGLLNLSNEKIPYNSSLVKERVLKDLKALKSFKSFEVVYISRYDLNKRYRHLSYKNGAVLNHSKLIRLDKNCFLVKTVLSDDLSLKLIAPRFKLESLRKKLLNKSGKGNSPDFEKEVGNPSNFNFSSVNAWEHLKEEENIAFYSYVNYHGLDKPNRQLLKAIRKMEGGKPFYDVIADTELAITQIAKELSDYYESDDATLAISDVVYKEWRLTELEDFASSFGEEDNSLSSFTPIEEYGVPYWLDNRL